MFCITSLQNTSPNSHSFTIPLTSFQNPLKTKPQQTSKILLKPQNNPNLPASQNPNSPPERFLLGSGLVSSGPRWSPGSPVMFYKVYYGLTWSNLGLICSSLVQFNLVWFVLVLFILSNLILCGLVRSVSVWSSPICSCLVWSCLVWSAPVVFIGSCVVLSWSYLCWSGLMWSCLQVHLICSGLVLFIPPVFLASPFLALSFILSLLHL